MALLIFLLVLSSALAQDRKVPVEIRASRLEADYSKGVLHFIGQVVVKRGDFLMESQQMRVYLTSRNGTQEVDWVEAWGEVKLSQQKRRGTCGRALYFARDERVVLEEDPVLWEGENRIKGGRIVVFLREDRAIVEGAPGKGVELTVVEEGGEGRFLPRP